MLSGDGHRNRSVRTLLARPPKTEHFYPADLARRITGIDLCVNDRSRDVA
jgi:hypothetical protein